MDNSSKQENIYMDEHNIELQNYYIQQIKKITIKNYESTGKQQTAIIKTFGCQMNVHDSEKLNGMLQAMGYSQADNEETADLILYNTCCVRENAENKVYGNIGALQPIKKENKNLKIVVCGCMMQQETVIKKIKKSYSHVDVIFGTYNVHNFPKLLFETMNTGKLVIDIWEEHGEIIEDQLIKRENPYKSNINIMYGCNNYCSYCIVPYVRGRERSREVEDILKEIKLLANSGVIEVMLLGQNVNSYGKNLKNPVDFSYLLREINKIDGIRRIRFMTSHPKDLSDNLISAMKDCDKVCNYIHLPIQSGSSDVLEKMNRIYSKEDYLTLVNKLKSAIPNISISTDIIIGFPGETEEDFQETLDVVKKVGFSGVYTFIYSKRTGTPAAIMEGQISDEITKERFNRLLAVTKPASYKISKSNIGKTLEILVDEVNHKDNTLMTGRSYDNTTVHFKGTKSLIGKIVNVKIINCKTFYLIGELSELNELV